MSSSHAAAYARAAILGILAGCGVGAIVALAVMVWWRGL